MIQAGIELVKSYEAFRPYPYPDPGSKLYKATPRFQKKWGFVPPQDLLDKLDENVRNLSGKPWTIGYGETENVALNDKTSEAEAYTHLVTRLGEFELGVLEACVLKPNKNQLAAMVSLAYNIGITAFKTKCSVLKRHNEGNFQAAGRSFGLWNKAGGVESNGLTRRRQEESVMYLRPVEGSVAEAAEKEQPISQELTPESRPWQSPIIVGSGISGVAGTVAVTKQVITDVKDTAKELGDWLPWVIVAVTIVIAAGYVINTRRKQRLKGFA